MKVSRIVLVMFAITSVSTLPLYGQGVDIFGGYQVLQNSFSNLCSMSCRPSLPLGWGIDLSGGHIVGQMSGSYGTRDVSDFGITTKDHIHTFLGGTRFGPNKPIAPFGEVLGGLLRRHSEYSEVGLPLRRATLGKQFLLVLGSGVDMRVSEHLAVRVVADWLHGYEHNRASFNPQNVYMPSTNTVRLQTGIVVHLK